MCLQHIFRSTGDEEDEFFIEKILDEGFDDYRDGERIDPVAEDLLRGVSLLFIIIVTRQS